MRENFPRCLRLVLRHEGGYVNHPKDPGGATNKGVTQRVYDAWRKRSDLSPRSVKNITDNEVNFIYLRQYWTVTSGDMMPVGVDYANFDTGVNSGPRQANKWLQRSLGVPADGVVGEITLSAVKDVAAKADLIRAMIKRRTSFLRSLRHWKTFGRGWTRRVAGVEAEAVRMTFADADEGRREVTIQSKKSGGLAKKQSTGAGASGAGGAGTATQVDISLFDTIGPWLTVGVAAVAVITAAVLLRRAMINRERSEAYRVNALN